MSAMRRTADTDPKAMDHPEEDPGVTPGALPAAAAKGMAVSGLIAALVGALIGAPFGFIEFGGLELAMRVAICAVVGAAACSVFGGLLGGWAGWGAAKRPTD